MTCARRERTEECEHSQCPYPDESGYVCVEQVGPTARCENGTVCPAAPRCLIGAGREKKKPTVKLVGKDGNAFVILGACARAARKAGWTGPEITAFTKKATTGDYVHLLVTVTAEFDVR